MSDEGWVKLHRCLLESLVWETSNSKQRDVLINLLLMANHKAKDWVWEGKRYSVGPGQFITSLDSIKAKCSKDVTIQNIRTALVHFESLEFLTNKSTNRGRMITIVNWALYQTDDKVANKQTNRQLTSNQQATNKQLTTNKNVKNVKNVKNIYTDLSESFMEAIKDFSDMRKKIRKPMTDKAIELLIKRVQEMSKGDDKRAVYLLNYATERSWMSVYEPNEGNQFSKEARQPASPTPASFKPMPEVKSSNAIPAPPETKAALDAFLGRAK